jgi:hypothetical protein
LQTDRPSQLLLLQRDRWTWPLDIQRGQPMETRTDLNLKEIALQAGRAVLSSEHKHYVAERLDDCDHVPRILRIAGAVASASLRMGLAEGEAISVRETLESYGKELYMAEWSAQIMEGEDARRVTKEGLDEYDRLSNAARRWVEKV